MPVVHLWGLGRRACPTVYVQLLRLVGRLVVVLVEPLCPECQLRRQWGQKGLEGANGVLPWRGQAIQGLRRAAGEGLPVLGVADVPQSIVRVQVELADLRVVVDCFGGRLNSAAAEDGHVRSWEVVVV